MFNRSGGATVRNAESVCAGDGGPPIWCGVSPNTVIPPGVESYSTASDSDMSYVGVEANSMYTGTTAGQGIRIEHVVQCEGAPPGPCQTASCTAAVFLYRQANVRAYFTCLSETNLEVGSPSSSTLSNVLNSADCIGSTTGVAALAPVIEACLSHCEYRAFRCYTEPALNATCKPYLIVAELGRERGAPVTFNLTNMLLPGTNAVQQACTAAPIGMARGVQPPPPGAAATCVANIGTCVDDPECNHCFEVMKLSASLRVNTSELLQNCTDARAFAMLETMFKPSSCASVAAAGADDEWAGLQPHGPIECLRHVWACSNSDDTSGQQCIADLSDYADVAGVNTDDEYGGSATSDVGGSPQRWNAILDKSSCDAMIEAGASTLDNIVALDPEAPNPCNQIVVNCDFAESFFCLYEAKLCDNNPECVTCLAATPTVEHVQIRYTPNCQNLVINIINRCQSDPGYVQYLKCSDTVTTNNQLVYVTSVFGSLSLLGALAVVAVIYAYRKDEESLRERILIGVFFGNAIYSAVNIVPIGLQHEDASTCGDPIYGASEAFVRGMWFWGKYTMVRSPHSISDPTLPPLMHRISHI